MKLSFQHWLLIFLVILVAAIGTLTYKLIQESERADALEAANNFYEEDFENLLEENQKLIDSIRTVRKEKDAAISRSEEKVQELSDHFRSIINTQNNEEAVDNMRDLDSIRELFTRNYPDNSRASQGSN